MCSLIHVKAIGTKKSEILAKITFLGIFGQILPKTPMVTCMNPFMRYLMYFKAIGKKKVKSLEK